MGRRFHQFCHKKDDNQKAIEEHLGAFGYQVLDLSRVGSGVPDLLVSNRKEMWLIEVKASSKKKLTPAQVEFQIDWNGKPIDRIDSVEACQEWIIAHA